ncbi:MAG TPA: hypothetical protein VF190_00605 [Rhodothermales bacterium]
MSAVQGQESNAGTESVAGALLSTLESEAETLGRLGHTFELQLEALRNRQQDLLEQSTLQANDEVANLARLRQMRERQMRLLGRTLDLNADSATLSDMLDRMATDPRSHVLVGRLRTARGLVHARARETQDRCIALEGALQFAVQVGREMMHALQGLDQPVPAPVYTAQGGARQASAPRSLLNHVG